MIYQAYKDYSIIIKFGEGFQIMKQWRGKFFPLHRRNFHFNDKEQALSRAAEYIDRHPDKLEETFKELFIKFCKEVHDNPNGYGGTKIDTVYYLKAYKKLNNEPI